jgi:serine/threonine protein kinase
MELLEGGTLKDLIIERYNDSKDYLLLEEECAIIIKGILEGLNYLHSLNIIHRDIKPGKLKDNSENIMLSRKGNLNSIKICDFGLATNLDDSDSKRCGTLIYMAPELVQKQFYNESIDSWACGFILYILCSGGMHPVYLKEHDEDSYQECVKNVQGWEFPEKFPM